MAEAAVRLDRLLSLLGVFSRKETLDAIRAGRLSLDGKTLKDPARKILPGSPLCLDGAALDTRTERTIILHKPAGILTAARDAKQKTVMDLLPPVYRSLGCMPVGRLDKDTTGLLILTTDGTLAHRLIDPKRNVEKVYAAHVAGRLTDADIAQFHQGIRLAGFTCRPADMKILSANDLASDALAFVREGKFHQVRRMFGALGHEVLALHRTHFAGLALDGSLQPGQFREASENEVNHLKGVTGLDG